MKLVITFKEPPLFEKVAKVLLQLPSGARNRVKQDQAGAFTARIGDDYMSIVVKAKWPPVSMDAYKLLGPLVIDKAGVVDKNDPIFGGFFEAYEKDVAKREDAAVVSVAYIDVGERLKPGLIKLDYIFMDTGEDFMVVTLNIDLPSIAPPKMVEATIHE
mmetsp:Transcript_23054/g.57297  ORF Transcript_23054/g.57297 Transcript_23054/m.57297 type:complete len:159 (-) Transcript_23054:141-617(-)